MLYIVFNLHTLTHCQIWCASVYGVCIGGSTYNVNCPARNLSNIVTKIFVPISEVFIFWIRESVDSLCREGVDVQYNYAY